MTDRLHSTTAVMILCIAGFSGIFAQDVSKSAASARITSSARGGNGGGKPTPTPTPPPPTCSTSVANTNSWSGSGGLDTSFGVGGIVTSKLSPAGSTVEVVFELMAQADGKTLAVGEARNPDSSDLDGFVARFNADGTRDTGFGAPDIQNSGQRLGYVFVDFDGSNDFTRAAAIDSFGRILILAGSSEFKIARLDPNGDLDTDFGVGGKVILNSPGGGANSIAIQTNGQIVVAGGEPDFTAARLNPDGSLDTLFGNGGIASYSISGKRRATGAANSVAIQVIGGEERLVLGGRYRNGPSDPNLFTLLRLRNDGAVDQTFGNGGIVQSSVNGNAVLNKIVIDSLNRIIAAGWASGGPCGTDGVVARYLSSGDLDNSFSGDGIVPIDIYGGENVLYGVTMQADGKIIAVGDASNTDGTVRDLSLIRLNIDGSLDTSFGPGTIGAGRVTTDSGMDDYGFGGIAIQADGRIIAGGNRGSTGETIITRYFQ